MSRFTRPGYAAARQFYRDPAVAADYDFHRLGSRTRRARHAREWRTIVAALERTAGVRSLLDLPCGTGRFTGPLAERGYVVSGADISAEMIRRATAKPAPAGGVAGFVQADAEALPFCDASVDCVMSMRFMLHLDAPARVRVLRELARVSRRWLIVDYRHRYSLRYARWRLLSWLGVVDTPSPHVTRRQLEQELGAGGWAVREVLPVTRLFSDKWIVIGESRPVS